MFRSFFKFCDRCLESIFNLQARFLQFVIDLNYTEGFTTFHSVLRFLAFLVLFPVALVTSVPVMFLAGIRRMLGGFFNESEEDN